jgi:serine/threonine protein kinase
VIPVTFRPGQRLRGELGGDFLVLEWVGEGSYSRVYRAEGARGPVALKLAKAEVHGAVDRMRAEGEAHARFDHPAIPALLDTGRTEPSVRDDLEVPWLARRWVEGSTLRQRLERDRCLPLVRAVPVLLRLSDAVAALHAAGWSHGDLRPDNVLLEAGTHLAFLPDLGEARPATAHPPLLPRDLQQLGELLAWSLTGADPETQPERLSLAAGYHPGAVQLWQEVRDGRLCSAITFRDRLQRLARQLGLPEGKKHR